MWTILFGQEIHRKTIVDLLVAVSSSLVIIEAVSTMSITIVFIFFAVLISAHFEGCSCLARVLIQSGHTEVLLLLLGLFDADFDALALGIEEDGHQRRVAKDDIHIDEEAAFLARSDELAALLVENQIGDEPARHVLPVYNVQVLVKDDQSEVLGAREVQIPFLRVAEAGNLRLNRLRLRLLPSTHRLLRVAAA